LETTIISSKQPQFNSPLVTALAWSCFSPPLINNMQCAEATVSTPQLTLSNARREWLQKLDANDKPLRSYMQENCHSNRLGLVFESLWHFFLQEDSATELIAHNIPVRNDHQTLGEFDVLYYCQQSQQAVHLELAVKFFLGLNLDRQAPSLSHWFGPNRADRLDRKLARLRQHQLPLAHTDAGKAALRKYGIENPRQELQVSGILFHAENQATPHHSLNPSHQRGRWQTVAEFTHSSQESDAQQWRYLAKPSWLEGQYNTAATLENEHIALANERPIMMINSQQERLFIVPNQWPETL
jgi:hypothetical protein